jgi:hypothetical protein
MDSPLLADRSLTELYALADRPLMQVMQDDAAPSLQRPADRSLFLLRISDGDAGAFFP